MIERRMADIDAKIRETQKALGQLKYKGERISAKEFYDYMTGDTFAKDTTTMLDVLGNEFLMVHEIVEMSELKKMGQKINKYTIMEAPKTMIYNAHFAAMESELNYAFLKKDFFWIKVRLKQHKDSVLGNDPYLPEKLRPRADALMKNFTKLIAKSTHMK